MRKLLKLLYTSGIISALVLSVLVNPASGLIMLLCCIPLVFAWPLQSASGLQALLFLFALMCFIGTMTTSAWYPWAGVGIFVFLTATVTMGGDDN